MMFVGRASHSDFVERNHWNRLATAPYPEGQSWSARDCWGSGELSLQEKIRQDQYLYKRTTYRDHEDITGTAQSEPEPRNKGSGSQEAACELTGATN